MGGCIRRVCLVSMILLAPAQAATWAVTKYYDSSDCTTSPIEQSPPKIIDQCIHVQQGTYVKHTCSGGNLASICYTDAACNVVSDQNPSDQCPNKIPLNCHEDADRLSTTYRSVDCSIEKDVVMMNAWPLTCSQGGPNLSTCASSATVLNIPRSHARQADRCENLRSGSDVCDLQ